MTDIQDPASSILGEPDGGPRPEVVDDIARMIGEALRPMGDTISCAELLSGLHLAYANTMRWTKQNSSPESYASNMNALRRGVRGLMMALDDPTVM